jgi:hypothetical protein
MAHLLIGLGGTGGKVLAAFRRSVFQQFGSADTADLALDYLYIDSDSHDVASAANTTLLEESDKTWRVLGRSVQLSPAQILHLKPGNLDHIIQNVEEYTTLKRWIGDRSVWNEIRAGAPNGITAAGQLRRFGRLLLAQNIADVRSAITGRLSQPRGQAVSANWTFHIVAGLAGGTGSGTLLDLVSLIREIPQGATGKIVIYAVLPEAQETNWAKHNYYANGYAALAELNALIVGQHRLSNIADSAGLYGHGNLVDNVFVVTNVNEQGIQIDMGSMVPALVAETMYQIVVASGEARTLGDVQQRVGGNADRVWRQMVTGENYIGQYEADPGGPPMRANRFLSFGLKRIAIPTEEIHDFAAGTLVQQFLLQTTHNNWVEGHGFTDADRAFDAPGEARKAENQNAWCLTLSHLKLEQKMLDSDSAAWSAVRNQFLVPLNGVRGKLTGDKETWTGQLDKFAEDFFRTGFRQVGVEEFYRVAERTIPDRARFIVRDRVATSQFAAWRDGQLSLREVDRVLAELIVDTQDKIAKCDKQMEQETANQKAAAEKRSTQAKDYHSPTLVKSLLGAAGVGEKAADKLAKYAETLADQYGARSSLLALGFAKRLLSGILTELADLRATVEVVANRMEAALKRTELAMAGRVQPKAMGTGDAQTTKLFDADHIRVVMNRIQQDQTLQREMTNVLRQTLVGSIGPNPTFARMAESVSEGRLLAVIEELAQERVEKVLKDQESARDRILETSIIQKLYDEYDGREAELRAFIGTQVQQAASFAPLDPNERIAHNAPAVESVTVAFVPAAIDLPEELRGFHALLCRVISAAAAGRKVEIVETSGNQQEIVFLSLVNQFALRHLATLKFLRSRYEKMLYAPDGKPAGDAARKRLELHLEGDGSNLPSLHPMSPSELRDSARGHFLIGRLEEVLRERRNPGTGADEVFMIAVDASGLEMPLVVGTSFARGVQDLDIAAVRQLREQIQRKIDAKRHIDERKALVDKLTQYQNEIMRAHDYDQGHPVVAQAIADVAAARALIPA